jgi:hypothetical protein
MPLCSTQVLLDQGPGCACRPARHAKGELKIFRGMHGAVSIRWNIVLKQTMSSLHMIARVSFIHMSALAGFEDENMRRCSRMLPRVSWA